MLPNSKWFMTLKNVTEEFQMLADPTLISLNITKVVFKVS